MYGLTISFCKLSFYFLFIFSLFIHLLYLIFILFHIVLLFFYDFFGGESSPLHKRVINAARCNYDHVDTVDDKD